MTFEVMEKIMTFEVTEHLVIAWGVDRYAYPHLFLETLFTFLKNFFETIPEWASRCHVTRTIP